MYTHQNSQVEKVAMIMIMLAILTSRGKKLREKDLELVVNRTIEAARAV